MVLNMQQQNTIAAWAMTYDNDREAIGQARSDFNISLHCGKVEKTIAGNGKHPERKTSWKASQ